MLPKGPLPWHVNTTGAVVEWVAFGIIFAALGVCALIALIGSMFNREEDD